MFTDFRQMSAPMYPLRSHLQQMNNNNSQSYIKMTENAKPQNPFHSNVDKRRPTTIDYVEKCFFFLLNFHK